MYCLRKTHKNNLALIPIVSCINSPTYNLAKFINEILAPLTTTFHHNLKNSFELVDRIKDINLPNNYILLSLDVKSLFTNIPKKLAIESSERTGHTYPTLLQSRKILF